MSQNHNIESLAEAILHNTRKVGYYLRSKGLNFPSFEIDAPSESLIPAEAVEIQNARADVINDTRKLRDLMLGPRGLSAKIHGTVGLFQHSIELIIPR